jgi:hypothetical protein
MAHTEEDINEEKISKLLEIWKSNESYEFKMQNKFTEIHIILRWLVLLIEIKIKNNAILNSVEKQKKAQEEMKEININIKNINSEILTIKLNLKKIKFSLENIKSKGVFTY